VLSIGSRRSSLSEFQAVGPVYLQMPDAHTSWDCVEAQRGNDAWQNENVVDWPHPFQKSRRTERRTTRQTDRLLLLCSVTVLAGKQRCIERCSHAYVTVSLLSVSSFNSRMCSGESMCSLTCITYYSAAYTTWDYTRRNRAASVDRPIIIRKLQEI